MQEIEIMYFRKIIMLSIATVSLGIGLAASRTDAHANYYLNGNEYAQEATRFVTVRKTVSVYKIKTGNCEANNHWTFYKKLHKGSKVRISRWFMSTGGWIIKSKKYYYHNSRTFFIVPTGNGHWYYK